jgi:hypothetical protein
MTGRWAYFNDSVAGCAAALQRLLQRLRLILSAAGVAPESVSLNLNLLGLVVTLNQVHLNITAVPGAGALLGNLLCAVVNLLNGGGPLSSISALLNQILALR